MNLKRLLACAFMLLLVAGAAGQTRFRSGVFLHHSTGGRIWGPNGSQVSVPGEIAKFNSGRGLTGSDSVKMIEQWWPSGDNEWVTWHNIFDNKDTANNIQSFLAAYPVIMIKSCYPSSSMSGLGSAKDTTTPTVKSVANYKWHWRALVSAMKKRPQNFFIIWTNAPLVAGATNASQAALANVFCRWAKDTLAAGLDPLVGAFPKNIFVFDFFHILANPDGMLPNQLASSLTDSHPNAAATTIAALQLVTQLFEAALAYESTTGVGDSHVQVPEVLQLDQNYPNPFNPSTTIQFALPSTAHVSLSVYDVLGCKVMTLVDGMKSAGVHDVQLDARSMASGMYVYRIQAGGFSLIKRLVVLR
jgi:hypothetical protein